MELNTFADFATIAVGITTIITLVWNWQTNRKQVFQARFNFLFQHYQSISTLSDDTQKAFHQKIINLTRAGIMLIYSIFMMILSHITTKSKICFPL